MELTRTTLRTQGKRLVGWLVVLAVVVVVLVVVFLGTPFEGPDEGIERIEADEAVTLSETSDGYVLSPADGDPAAGLVFYSGARVSPSAYVESLAPVAGEANVAVFVPRQSLTLAVVDYGIARTGLRSDPATAVMDRYPEVENWYVGGHSLGGAMACRYANIESDSVDGLILYGSYCDRDISERDLSVLSVAGADDTVLNWEAYERGLDRLPPGSTVVTVSDFNHTQFGSYSGQRGDTPTGTSYESAHSRLNEITVSWFQNETTGSS